MKDETFVFIQDVKEKRTTARSARNARTHTGKSGAVKLPCDYMTPKELKAMNGECKSYRLNDPLSWGDFKVLPDDLKTIYIKSLREKYNIPDFKIAEAMGISKQTMIFEIRRLGLSKGKKAGGKIKWKQDEFYAWWSGAKNEATAADDANDDPVAPLPCPDECHCDINEVSNDNDEPEAFEEPKALNVYPERIAEVRKKVERKPAVPVRGELAFCGSAEDALKTAAVLLGGQMFR